MIEDIWKESSLGAALEELAQERGEARGRAKGRAEGEAKGRAEGRTQGRGEGMRQLAQIALEGRFGTVDEDVQAALGTADETTLRLLVAHLSTDTIEYVRARLGLSQEIQGD